MRPLPRHIGGRAALALALLLACSGAAAAAIDRSGDAAATAEPPLLTLRESEADEHVVGTRLYYNRSGGNSGVFTVAAEPTNAAEVQRVVFPALFDVRQAFDRSGPYEATYGWTAASTDSGEATVTVKYRRGGSVSSTFTVLPDEEAPLTSDDADAAWRNAPVTVNLRAADAGAGVAATYATANASAPAEAFPAATSVELLSEGVHEVRYFSRDYVGNVEAVRTSGPVRIDRTAPALPALAVVEQSAFAHVVGRFGSAVFAVFVNPLRTGSFAVEATAHDALSGVDFVRFPGAEDASEPYSASYALADLSGPQTVVAFDRAGNRNQAGFEVVRDTTAPAGGSISYPTGFRADASVTVATEGGSDAGAGIDPASATLERQTAQLAGGQCGAFGEWIEVASPDLVGSGTCARYRSRVSDRVGNEAVYGPAGEVKIDLDPPVVTLDDPGALLRGTVALSGTESDAGAGLSSRVFQYAPAGETTWTSIPSPWDTSLVPDGLYDLRLLVFDLAGNSGEATVRGRRVDNAAPRVSVTSPGSGASVSGTVAVTADAFDNFELAGVQFRLDGADLGAEDTEAPYAVDWDTALAAAGTHTLSAVARDRAGNRTVSAPVEVTIPAPPPAEGKPFAKVVVGPGFVDASTRQVVRTADDRVYIFAADDGPSIRGEGAGVLRAYKADRAGIPTRFAEVDVANRPHAGGTAEIAGADARIDPNGTVHVIYVDNYFQTELVYRTFSTVTDTWGPAETIATGLGAQRRGAVRFGLTLDAEGRPHVVYLGGGELRYTNRSGGSWSTARSLAFTSFSYAVHPSLTFDLAGNLHVAWLDDSFAASIRYVRRSAAGVWSPLEWMAVNDALTNSNLDQGPSIAVTRSGVPYVTFVSALPASSVVVTRRTESGWVADDVPPGLYTHTPQIYARNDDVYVFLGHDREINFGYVHKLSGQSWSSYTKLTSDQDDGSASVRWDALYDPNPSIIDATFFDEDSLGDRRFIPELYYMAVLPSEPGEGADTTPPSAILTAPRDGTTVAGAVAVTAEAADDRAVAGVQFRLDGADLGIEDTEAPYAISWDSTRVVNGAHTFQAVARDAAGNRTTSLQIRVTVDNSAAAPANGLVAAYSFDEGLGPVAGDASGNGNGGVLSGATWTGDGRFGGALSFDGVDDWVTVADSASLDLTAGMTLEAWVKPAATRSWPTVLMKEGSPFAYALYANSDAGLGDRPNALVYVGCCGATDTRGDETLTPGAWTHLAATYDGTALRLYVNGGAPSPRFQAGTIRTSDKPLRIGGSAIFPDERFAGLIDEIRIYNRALTETEIRADMLAGIGGGAPPPDPPADTQAPAVSITAPAAGATVSGTVTITADATDDSGVAGVQFKVDGANVGSEDTVAPYSISWSTLNSFAGAHTITAVARDSASNVTTSAPVSVIVDNSAPAPAPTGGLVAAYSFDEGTGEAVADSSGKGNGGVVSGAAWTAAGKHGGALAFDGVDDWVTVADSASLDLDIGMTVEAWVKPASLRPWQTVVMKERDAHLSYALYAVTDPNFGNVPSAHVFRLNDNMLAGRTTLPTGTWTHLAMTYDGAYLHLYVNGTEVTFRGAPSPIETSNGPLRIGGNQAFGNEWFEGVIDDVRVYNRALEPAEIVSDMDAPVAR